MGNDADNRDEETPTVEEVTLPAETERAIAVAARNARRNTALRDQLIVDAARNGASLRELALAADLHHTTIRKIIRREVEGR